MSLSMQQKLLKALDEKTFYPVGSSVPIRSDFTIISATCEEILEKVQKKEFREDLYFRLSGFHFHLKSLSERPEDIDLLVKFFQKKFPRRFFIKPEALLEMRKHTWPGNIRELSKVCERFSQSLSGIIDLGVVRKTIIPQSQKTIPQLEGWEDYVLNHGLRAYITHLEKRAVEESLKRNNGKITACIKELKISSSAFYRILQDHKLTF
jgi:DNA-binding NtrC family response regulator